MAEADAQRYSVIVLNMFFLTFDLTSVADPDFYPGYLIPDLDFPSQIQDPGSWFQFWIPDSDPLHWIDKELKYFQPPKIVPKLSEINDPIPDSGSRG